MDFNERKWPVMEYDKPIEVSGSDVRIVTTFKVWMKDGRKLKRIKDGPKQPDPQSDLE